MARWGVSLLGFAGLIRRIHRIKNEFDGEAEFEVRAGEGLRYAGFVEFGTGRGRAQPYMRPAAEAAQQNVPELWDRAVGSNTPASQMFPGLVAEYVATVARELVPVRTGALRDSITVYRVG